MIELVTDTRCLKPVCLEYHPLAVAILRLDSDGLRAMEHTALPRDGEASLYTFLFALPIGNLRIDKLHQAVAHIDRNHAAKHSHLHSRQTDARRLVHRLRHVVKQLPQTVVKFSTLRLTLRKTGSPTVIIFRSAIFIPPVIYSIPKNGLWMNIREQRDIPITRIHSKASQQARHHLAGCSAHAAFYNNTIAVFAADPGRTGWRRAQHNQLFVRVFGGSKLLELLQKDCDASSVSRWETPEK